MYELQREHTEASLQHILSTTTGGGIILKGFQEDCRMQSPVKTLEQGSVSTATQTSLSIISWENPTPNTE